MDTYLEDQIVDYARSYKGVKWKHMGRSRQGVDCAGLVIMVAKRIGYKDPNFNTTNYARLPEGYNFINYFKDHLTQIPNNACTKGDVLVVKAQSRYPCHCGILNIDDNGYKTFIHASAKDKMVLEEPYEHFRTRHVGTFRFIL